MYVDLYFPAEYAMDQSLRSTVAVPANNRARERVHLKRERGAKEKGTRSVLGQGLLFAGRLSANNFFGSNVSVMAHTKKKKEVNFPSKPVSFSSNQIAEKYNSWS